MVKRILLFIALFLLVAFSLVSAFLIYAKEDDLTAEPVEEETTEEKIEEEYDFASMTTYEMFWPVVAGKVPGDKYYELKLWRDKVSSFFSFGKLKKAEMLKMITNKRIVEAEKLVELKRYSLISPTLKTAEQALEKGLNVLSAAKNKHQYSWLKNEYAKDARKYLVVLERMEESVGDDQRAAVKEFFDRISELIKEFELEIAPRNF